MTTINLLLQYFANLKSGKKNIYGLAFVCRFALIERCLLWSAYFIFSLSLSVFLSLCESMCAWIEHERVLGLLFQAVFMHWSSKNNFICTIFCMHSFSCCVQFFRRRCCCWVLSFCLCVFGRSEMQLHGNKFMLTSCMSIILLSSDRETKSPTTTATKFTTEHTHKTKML